MITSAVTMKTPETPTRIFSKLKNKIKNGIFTVWQKRIFHLRKLYYRRTLNFERILLALWCSPPR